MKREAYPWGVMKPGEFRWFPADQAKEARNSAIGWAALHKRRISIEPIEGGSVIITVRKGMVKHGKVDDRRRLTKAAGRRY